MIGTIVSHYRIIEKLGEGGMGVVYKAHDAKLDRIVALKFLPAYLASEGTERERFIHEARAAASLNHPNITTVYEIDEFETQVFIVMEFVEGKTLKQLIESDIPPLKKVLDIAIQVCDGLAAAHERGVVHRDIKSTNIMMTPKGQVKIMDFGLAKLKGATKLTKAGSTLGTTSYMSPEQALGEEVDHRSDIFSFGVLLYELLTGNLPFRGEHPAAIVYSILNEPPQPIARFNDKVTPEIDRIVSKALAKEKEDRYQHIGEMSADLRRERKNLEYARPTTVTQAMEMPKPRKRTMKFLIPISAVALLLVLVILFNPFRIKVTQNQTAEASKNSLAVMYFENIPDPEDKDHTGEMLTNLLITSLFQTKGLEVISRERLYDIQKELGNGESKSITPSLATKVAQRAGVSMMLLGSVLQKEPTLTVTFRLLQVHSGKILSTQRLTGFSTDKIFALVDTMALLVRTDLKIGMEAGVEAKSVAEVTTSSPEAYRSYLEGFELSQKLLWTEARGALNRAVELDPDFAMAYSLLAFTDRILGDNSRASRNLLKAWELRGKVTERERLLIEANYAGILENNPRREAEIIEELLKKYPHEQVAYFQLQDAYVRLNQYEKANEILLHGLKYIPEDRTLWNGLAYWHAALGRKKEALEAVNKYLQLAPGEFNPYDSKGEIHSLFGEIDSALYWYQKATTFRQEFSSIEKIGYIAMLRQDYQTAEKYFRQGISSGSKLERAIADADLSLILAHRGQLAKAASLLRNYLNSQQDPEAQQFITENHLLLALLFYEMGDYSSMAEYARIRSATLKKSSNDRVFGRDLLAWALMKKGDKKLALKTMEELKKDISEKLPLTQVRHDYASALLAYEEGRYDAALELFRKVYRTLVPNRMPQYFYAVTLLKTGNTSEAIDEFQKMAWWVPVAAPAPSRLDFLPTWFYWPIAAVKAHYWLGVAYEQQGEKEKAIKDYEKFLDIWREADTNLPVLSDAKQRLARLKGVS